MRKTCPFLRRNPLRSSGLGAVPLYNLMEDAATADQFVDFLKLPDYELLL